MVKQTVSLKHVHNETIRPHIRNESQEISMVSINLKRFFCICPSQVLLSLRHFDLDAQTLGNIHSESLIYVDKTFFENVGKISSKVYSHVSRCVL